MRLVGALGRLLVFAAALLFLVLCFSRNAAAQDKVDSLAKRLKTSSDFRVRTQAALALGATANKRAVAVLCTGLNDGNTTVRAASAAGLGRLSLGGGDCLRRRLKAEGNEDVRSVIRRALKRIAAERTPKIDGSTRYYVAIAKPTNNTSRSSSALDRVVRGALTKELSQLPGFVVAPSGETPTQAKLLLEKHPKVKGIWLWPKVGVSYPSGSLRLVIELSLFTYPGKALKGSMKRKLTMPDTEPGDTSSENQLIEMAAERLAPDLARTAARI